MVPRILNFGARWGELSVARPFGYTLAEIALPLDRRLDNSKWTGNT
jgi:hypothetical protein